MGLYTKKIQEALGLNEKQNNVFYGDYKGYEMTLCISQQGMDVFLNFYASDEEKYSVAKLFQSAKTNKMVRTEVSIFGIHSMINGMTFKSILKKIIEKLDVVVDYMAQHEILGVGHCMSCGATGDNLQTIRLNDVYVTLDEECVEKLTTVVNAADQEFAALPNNYGKGIAGAFLGAAIGAVAWVVLYMIGFVSALIAVLAVFLGNYFWVKFGGKSNSVKTISVAVISLVVLVLTCLGVYVVVVGGMLAEANNSTPVLEFIMSNKELKGAFIYDMAMNAVFTLIGVAAQYASTKKKDQAQRIRISK